MSRPLSDLCCVARAALFNLCLSERDLRALGAWHDGPDLSGCSPAVVSRAHLSRAAQHDPEVAAAVADRLDLAFLDTVMAVRSMDAEALDDLVEGWTRRPDGRALPGLLWALCSDARDEAFALGNRLCHEALTRALDGLVECGPVAPSR